MHDTKFADTQICHFMH